MLNYEGIVIIIGSETIKQWGVLCRYNLNGNL